MKKLTIAAALLLAACASPSTTPQEDEGGWVRLAQKTVAFNAETDTVSMIGKPQNLSKVKLTCTQGTVKLKQLRVTLSDGSTETFKPKGTGVFTKGMSSFAFAMPGDDLKVRAIAIAYDSAGNIVMSKRARVEVWGKKRSE